MRMRITSSDEVDDSDEDTASADLYVEGVPLEWYLMWFSMIV
jgi:hypothetical protein